MKFNANHQALGLSGKSILALGGIMLIGFVLGCVVAVIIEKVLRANQPKRIVIRDTASPNMLAEIVVTGDVDQLNAMLDEAEESNRRLIITTPKRGTEGALFARAVNTLCARRHIECKIDVGPAIKIELGDLSQCMVIVENCAGRFEGSLQRLVSRGWIAEGAPAVSKSFWGTRYVQRMSRSATENTAAVAV